MSVSVRLWNKCLDAALASATANFVVSLTRGTMSTPSFKVYIAQDAFYLKSFQRAFASAASICKDTSDPFGVDHFESLRLNVENELKMHAEFAKSLEIDLSNVNPLPQTLLYTDFLDATAKRSTVSYICAATTPCMTLYAWLGKRAKDKGLDQPTNPYRRWIEEYSSDGFQNHARNLEMLLDHYAAKDDAKFDELLKLYAKAMELEYNFFSAHATPSWSGLRPGLIGIDFDDTISDKDTISRLCRAGLKAQGAAGDAVYSGLLENYGTKYTDFMSTQLPSSPVAAFKQADIDSFIAAHTVFEDSMLDPVEESKILSGITPEILSNIAKEVELKPNAIETLSYIVKQHPSAAVNILSVNWSKKFIENVLSLSADKLSLKKYAVYANELAGLSSPSVGGAADGLSGAISTAEDFAAVTAVSTGAIERVLTGPGHKRDLFKTLSSKSPPGKPTVYIGDSLGDLAALLEADVGVIIGSSSSLRRVCSLYGVTIKSVDELIFTNFDSSSSSTSSAAAEQKKDVAARNASPVLYAAESWAHIGFALFGKGYTASWLSKWTEDVYGLPKKSFSSSSSAAAGGCSIPRVLSVAGSDSGGGAGMQADIKTCEAFQVFSTTAITALTAQSTRGVSAVNNVSVEMLRSQLDEVLSDIGTDAVKTGMIPNAALAHEVARAITHYAVSNVVVDPVMVSTSGCLLMAPEEAKGIVHALFPLATVVTPNIPEAIAILKFIPGYRYDNNGHDYVVNTIEDMENVAKALHSLGSEYVLVKGGHLALHPEAHGGLVGSAAAAAAADNVTAVKELVDVLYDGQRFEYIRGPLIKSNNVHGTGCTLSSAIASELARGIPVVQAVRSARRYLTATIQLSASSRIGTGAHGPMLHNASTFASPKLLAPLGYPAVSGTGRKFNPIDLSVYGVTDSSLNQKYGHSMEEAVAAAVAGGATVIQIREKNTTTESFVDMARRCLAITRRAGVPLIINDRVDVALAVGADGVHVGQSDMSAVEVRRLIGPDRILGVSAKSPEQAHKAEADGADYIGVGAVYPTTTKVITRNIGVEGLREVRECGITIPVVAIGGISGEEKVSDCLLKGNAHGIAVVTAIFGHHDIHSATASLADDVRKVLAARAAKHA